MRTIEIVAKNLKFYRQQRGLTQEELASKAYTSASYISRIERMVANPSIESLDSIAMALGISPPELFRMDEVDILPEQYDEFRRLRGISSTMEPWRKSLFLRVVSSTLSALRDWKPEEEEEKTGQQKKNNRPTGYSIQREFPGRLFFCACALAEGARI